MAFQLSTGSVVYIYVPEVAVDRATGLAVAVQSANFTIVAFTFEYMINSSLQVHGTIWYFASLNFLAFLFFMCFMKETRGLTDL